MTSQPRTCLALVATLLCLGGAVGAASFDDPDWPCIQRKMPDLSVGQMWPGPAPEGNWRENPDIKHLAETLALRRTTLDQVTELATGYAKTLPEAERPAHMALVFSGVLDRIGAERHQVISGIGRYAHRQTALSDRIKAEEADLAKLKSVPAPDLDQVEALQDTLDWDIRVFRERAQSLTYVCETPVLLEQRAFAIARILAGNN